MIWCRARYWSTSPLTTSSQSVFTFVLDDAHPSTVWYVPTLTWTSQFSHQWHTPLQCFQVPRTWADPESMIAPHSMIALTRLLHTPDPVHPGTCPLSSSVSVFMDNPNSSETHPLDRSCGPSWQWECSCSCSHVAWTVTSFFVGWHNISHVDISSLSRLLQHAGLESQKKGALLWLQVHSNPGCPFGIGCPHCLGLHAVIQLSWSPTLKTLSSCFPIGRMPAGDQ